MKGVVKTLSVLLVAALVFGGVWLDYRSRYGGGGSPTSNGGESLPPLPGFRADVAYLPDEPLLGFVEIPGGPFLMGSDSLADTLAYDIERWAADHPQGSVDVPAFFIGWHEVTVAQFRAFAQAAPYEPDAQALAASPLLPVAFVSWPDALAYCRWLEDLLRTAPATPPELRSRLAAGWRVTLPSEAEWEKAARGADERIFPWGNEPRSDRANFASGRPAPAGEIPCPECPYGLLDMSGNVWEWTRSPYQPYPYDKADDREGAGGEALWVMRGGSFADPLRNVRAAARGAAGPDVRRAFIGFRVVIAR